MRERGRPYHHGDLKQALIDTGFTLLKEKGPAQLSLRAVARRAGVSHAAPYSHFSGKEDLIANIAIAGFEKLKKALLAEERFSRPKSRKDLLDFTWAYVSFGLDNPDFYRLMFSDMIHPSQHQGLGEVSLEAFSILVSGVEAAQKQKLCRTGDSFAYALSIWTSVHGLTSLLISSYIPEPHHHKQGTHETRKNHPCMPRQQARALCDRCMTQLYQGLKP